ncbi:MAG: AAA family ATPase [Chloroflexi bacterium]|nr:AAA family ATPase [Chloroflexota bacterium]
MGANYDIRQRARLADSGGLLTFIWNNRYKFILWLILTIGMIVLWIKATALMAGVFMMVFQLVYVMLFMIVQFGALFMFLGRGRVYWVQPGETGVTFDDYRGNDQVLEVARRIVMLLRGVRDFKQMGGDYTRGLLLEGPPGTGKSYLAQAIATEAGLPFAYASAPGFQNMFMGVGNLRVMMLYGKARKLSRKHGGAIIFIDEIDAIGMARSAQTGGGMMMGGMMGMGGMGLLNELLLQMDPPNFDNGWTARIMRRLGLKKERAVPPPVLTIGATNLASALDQALLRPGRFDRRIHVDFPDFDGRKDIIQYYLAKVRHEEMPLARMGNDTIGYTPVAIKFVINEAVIHAHFEGRDAITYEDFSRAREAHEWGVREPIRSMSLDEKRRLAYHEAGHAVAQVKLLPRHRLSKVTIIRHGSALGLSAVKPLEERHTQTREEALAWIQTGLASRAAEELFLGTRMSGGYGDLTDCTMLAYQMLTMWGADGSLFSYGPWGMGQLDPETKTRIEQVLEQEFKKAKALLAKYAGGMHEIAEGLVEHGELDGDDVIDILAKHDELIASGRGPRILPQYALASAGGIAGGVRALLAADEDESEDGAGESANGKSWNGEDTRESANGANGER